MRYQVKHLKPLPVPQGNPYLRGNYRLKEAMRDARISQDTLAAMMGCTPQSLRLRLSGKVDWRLHEMYRVMDLLDIPAEKALWYFPQMDKKGRVIEA